MKDLLHNQTVNRRKYRSSTVKRSVRRVDHSFKADSGTGSESIFSKIKEKNRIVKNKTSEFLKPLKDPAALIKKHRLVPHIAGFCVTLIFIFSAVVVTNTAKVESELKRDSYGNFIASGLSAEEEVNTVSAAEIAFYPELPFGADAGPGATGAGLKEREDDLLYTVKTGETLSQISRNFHIEIKKLIIYNNLLNPDSIKAGEVISIPSYYHESVIEVTNESFTEKQLIAVNNLEKETKISSIPGFSINSKLELKGRNVIASFGINDVSGMAYKSFMWDLGDGSWARRRYPKRTYTKPGTYKVSLIVTDAKGKKLEPKDVYVDVPFPATYKSEAYTLLTLNNVGEVFYPGGEIVSVTGISNSKIEKYFTEHEDNSYTAKKDGYFALSIKKKDRLKTLYLFVSPQESIHVENNELLWYRSQSNTGTQSNCGPTTASMGIAWSVSKYVSVIGIRQELGWRGNGGTGFGEITDIINKYGGVARQVKIKKVTDVFEMVDEGKLAVILFNTHKIAKTKGDPETNFYGKHYADNATGHYVIVKGYTADRKYLIVHDPMPKTWSKNNAMYNDGISIVGRNRYYSVADMSAAIKSTTVIQISN